MSRVMPLLHASRARTPENPFTFCYLIIFRDMLVNIIYCLEHLVAEFDDIYEHFHLHYAYADAAISISVGSKRSFLFLLAGSLVMMMLLKAW